MLTDIRRHANDPDWLDAHADDIYQFIKKSSRDRTLAQAFSALLLVAPHFLKHPDHAKWERLFSPLMMELMNLKDQDKLQQIWYHMGHYQMVSRTPKAAVNSMTKAANNANTELDRVQAFLGLLKAYTYHTNNPSADNCRDELLSYAAHTPRLYERGVIYQTIAQYDQSQGDIEHALGLAQMALVIWTTLTPLDEDLVRHIGESLLTMAISCRMIGRLSLAQQYVWEAQEHLEQLPGSFETYVACYEGGVHKHLTGDYEPALRCFNEVIDFFTAHDYPAYVASAKHSKGLVLTTLQRYEEAEETLLAALQNWDDLDNIVEQVNVQHALGYNYMEMGAYNTADRWLKLALKETDMIHQPGRRQFIRERLCEDIKTLETMVGQP